VQLAVELATRFNGEIVNADAMQMYGGLPIITNKLSDEEQRGIPHHLLGNIGLEEEPWTVAKFKPEATRIISEIRARGKLPIVVGGTSYYLDSLLFEEKLVPSTSGVQNRDDLNKQYPILTESAEVMLKKLREVDPVMADRWHPNDIRKIRTSLEVYLTTGRRASDIYAEQQSRKESKWASADSAAASPESGAQSPWKTLIFWLYAKPEVLNTRLEKRVDRMVDNGLLGEVTDVYDYLQGRLATGEQVDRTKGIWQSIGFKQFEPYLCALKQEAPVPGQKLQKLKETGIEETKTANRRYAKDQVRWISLKTMPTMQEEKVLDRLFLLDSSDIERYNSEVLEKGAELTKKLLADQDLPPPLELSETAREVLTAQAERRNRQPAVVPCNKTCDVCNKRLVTEREWEMHIKSNRHRINLNRKKRRALVVIDSDERQRVAAAADSAEPSMESSSSPLAASPSRTSTEDSTRDQNDTS